MINASSEPFAGAFGRYKDRKLVVWDAELFDDNENYYAVPGQVAQIDKNDGAVIVITGGGKLKLKEIEYDDFRGKPAEVIKSIRIRLE